MFTRMARLLGCLALCLLAAPGMGLAHHGWSGYDSSQTLHLTGTIQESGYEHPHGYLKLAVPDKVWLRRPSAAITHGEPGLTADHADRRHHGHRGRLPAPQ